MIHLTQGDERSSGSEGIHLTLSVWQDLQATALLRLGAGLDAPLSFFVVTALVDVVVVGVADEGFSFLFVALGAILDIILTVGMYGDGDGDGC